MDEDPKPPSPLAIVMGLAVTCYLLWSLFGASEPPGPGLRVLMWVLLLCNLAYFGFLVFRSRR